MNQPAKPDPPARSPSRGGGQAAGPSLADAVAGAALRAAEAPKEDPAKKWEEMGGELYDALSKGDRSGFSKLFATQVKIAVREELRGNK